MVVVYVLVVVLVLVVLLVVLVVLVVVIIIMIMITIIIIVIIFLIINILFPVAETCSQRRNLFLGVVRFEVTPLADKTWQTNHLVTKVRHSTQAFICQI